MIKKIRRRIRLMKLVVANRGFYTNLLTWIIMSGVIVVIFSSSWLDKATGIFVSFAGIYLMSFFIEGEEK
ncbi:MAG: hypothetical protein LBI57_08040 [Helicobacteraceae bacterium]|nr:hypothetical protein [Helicobacteraceae bacterium]